MKNLLSQEVVQQRFSLLRLACIFPASIAVGVLVTYIVSKLNNRSVWDVLQSLSPTTLWGLAITAICMTLIIALRQDEFVGILVIAAHLYLDWYLGMAYVAPLLTIGLLLVFFFVRSAQYPWVEPYALWLWLILLILSLFPTLRAINFLYGADYYLNIILGALLFSWLGMLIARDTACLRRFCQLLAVFAALVAIHTIIQTLTGVFVFSATRHDTEAQLISYLDSSAPGIHRAESFLTNADSNGTFLAMLLFIPLGLFLESSSLLLKVLYLAESFLMLPALLFTYSTGAMLAALGGLIVFLLLAGRAKYLIQISCFFLLIALIANSWFPAQVNLLIQHATNPKELLLRDGAWVTGLRVVQAFPLTGLGMGRDVYWLRADPSRVPAQYIPLFHPHNSYIELAALGGIPVLVASVALLCVILWQAFRSWYLADRNTRCLLAGGIATVLTLSLNSFTNAGWTLAPLAAIGWLVLGCISSPLLRKTTCMYRKNTQRSA